MALAPLGDDTLRSVYADFRCDTSTMSRVAFPGDGHDWNLLVAAPTVPAWEAFTRVMARHDVLFLESAGGTYNCRVIQSSGKWSMHAFGLAIDVNPSENPQQSPLTTVFTDAFIEAVESMVTASGRQVFLWGGHFSTPDTMHFQIGARPDEIATGIIDPMEEPMPLNADDLETIRAIVRDEVADLQAAVRTQLADNQAAVRTQLARQLEAVKRAIARNNPVLRKALTEPRDASPIGRAVFQYTRAFSPDNAAKLLRRIDRQTVPPPPTRGGTRRTGEEEEEETFTRGSPEGGEREPDTSRDGRSTGRRRSGSGGAPPPV